jgi:glycerol-3-phosphate dehydrogenase
VAAGPWTSRVAGRRSDGSRRLILTKGVHVFARRALAPGAALLLAAPADARIFFVIPWMGGTLIGTTDTRFCGAPDRVRATREDVRYLLGATNACLPGLDLGPADVVAVQAGLRPLVAGGDAGAPSAVSRDYRLHHETPGLVVVEGGKLTIFRKLAEQVVDRVVAEVIRTDSGRALGVCTTDGRPLPGAPRRGAWKGARARIVRRLARAGLAAESARHLAETYGVRAPDVVAAAGRTTALLRPACGEHPHVPAEAVLAVTSELAVTPADALLRRLGLGWWECGGVRCRRAWERAFRAAGLSPAAIRRGLAEHEHELAELWRV